ncbi:hypothetical protein CWI42_040260 [Ordospora colligata]|uniref:Uncharacterized protein n=1 Tax=Ordospora colligata OC4 TaxID=1354746 RepID=A0A0B2UKT2_9MICR|nr:uncharacterized protein M896_040260 [Ordospora colligata OC4]KHN69834.1 hypothetical protein M896_040260 [Ordospora colligata OC4]TBU16004.1 hypothetical protein CWI41_040260 [Ordospora colligata]TBU16217.1 hypothetical protein CWI40_040260 [Ordospora colligata]TBU18921.1 hypothetical protein CWI42_040260 [Ordospora colligata]
MEEIKEKFKIQVEMLSDKDIKNVVKKLDKEELDMFIDTMEGRNAELREKLVSLKQEVVRRMDNHELLMEAVGEEIPRKAFLFLKECLAEVKGIAEEVVGGDK